MNAIQLIGPVGERISFSVLDSGQANRLKAEAGTDVIIIIIIIIIIIMKRKRRCDCGNPAKAGGRQGARLGTQTGLVLHPKSRL